MRREPNAVPVTHVLHRAVLVVAVLAFAVVLSYVFANESTWLWREVLRMIQGVRDTWTAWNWKLW